jgi:hypothetical protein
MANTDADPTKPSLPVVPAIDIQNPEKTITGFLGWIQQQKEISQKKGEKWGWLFAVIAAVIVFIGMAVTAYKAWAQGREVASLKHELDVLNEQKHRDEMNALITNKENEQKEWFKKVDVTTKEISDLKSRLAQAEANRQLEINKINKVTTWEEVDKLIK